MKITFDSLFESRCNESGKPEYWKPNIPQKTPFQWNDYGIPEVVEKVLALQLVLELPVGKFVSEASPSELPISTVAKKLLLSNIGDENVHYHAFKYAADVYPVSKSTLSEAQAIAQLWIKSPGHPIEKPTLLECGVFTPALAFLQICGGQSLQTLAALVARDEQRHVATNRGVMRKLGMQPGSPSPHLDVYRYHTLEWLFDGLAVPKTVKNSYWFFKRDFDKDFLILESTNLVRQGFSFGLNQLLMGASIYVPPFEKENAEQAY